MSKILSLTHSPVCLGLDPEGGHLPLALDGDLAALLDGVGGGEQGLDRAGHVNILLLTEAHHPGARVHRVSEEAIPRALVTNNAPDHLARKELDRYFNRMWRKYKMTL